MKECRSCKKVKENDQFYKRLVNSDGLYSYCKECSLRKNKEITEEQRARRKEKNKEYTKLNKSYLLERSKKYYYDHREEVLKKAEQYRAKNRDKIALREAKKRIEDDERFEKNRIRHFSWSQNNREKLNAYQKEWYQKNKEKRRAHVVLRRAIEAQDIMRPKNCSQCHKECKPDGHHFDYSKPLDVIWVCRACHSRKSPRTVIR